VIPAHNEGKVLGRCLRSITKDAKPGEIEIVVVCNGCSDRTSWIARSFGPPVKVVETNIGNKCHALNCADAEITSFPRFYVDADVVLSMSSIRKVAKAMKNKKIMAAAPRSEMDLNGCSWPVRAYYRIWKRLPYFQIGLIGGGVYVLSEAGRKVIGQFPDLLGEDEYVRLRYRSENRCVVKDAWFSSKPPRTLGSFIKIRARHQRGRCQLMNRYPELWVSHRHNNPRHLPKIMLKPTLWPSLVIYVIISCLTRSLGWIQYHFYKNPMHWDRDHSSRL